MKTKSKFFKVCQAGETIDGRNITEEQIQQMADNYDPSKYAARVWCEHLRSIFPDGEFQALGDVLAVKAEKDDAGNLSLYAQIEPTDKLLEINKNRQKVYSSIEMYTKFPSVEGAYMAGLAVTDSPASLGTEMLKFSLQHKNDFSDADKDILKNIYSKPVENGKLEFTDEKEKETFKDKIAKISSMFKKQAGETKNDLTEVKEAVTELASSAHQAFSEQDDTIKTITEKNEQLSTEIDALKTKLNELETNAPEEYQQRPPAIGGEVAVLTDC